MRTDDPPIDTLLELANRAADAAATITLDAFRSPLQVQDKSARGAGTRDATIDPVTQVDRAAEQAIRDVLRAGAPHIGFVGEESADPQDLHGDGRRWVVDPIDGTRAYLAGMPVWGTLIALCDGPQATFGVCDVPRLGERFVGLGTMAYCVDGVGRHPLQVRVDVPLERAVVCCTTPDMFATAASRSAFEALARQSAVVRYGTDCYGYAMLAAGHVDLVVESDLSTWDVQALVPLVRGAGGIITDWQGGDPGRGGSVVAAASPALHARAVSRLAGHG